MYRPSNRALTVWGGQAGREGSEVSVERCWSVVGAGWRDWVTPAVSQGISPGRRRSPVSRQTPDPDASLDQVLEKAGSMQGSSDSLRNLP